MNVHVTYYTNWLLGQSQKNIFTKKTNQSFQSLKKEGADLSIWFAWGIDRKLYYIASQIAGLGRRKMPIKTSPIMGHLACARRHVDVSKETKRLFSFQKYILQENTSLGPVKLSLIEEKQSIISAYPNSSPYSTHWVRSPICINQRKSMKLYWFTQAYFLIQWYFRPYNYDLKWSMICYIFLKEKEGKAIQWIRVNWNMRNHITTPAKSNTSLLQLALHLLS